MAVEYSALVDNAMGIEDDFLPKLTTRQGRPNNAPMGDIGKIMRARRLELGLTLRQVADRSGMSYQLISQIEIGNRPNPTRNTLQKLAVALEMDVRDLLDPVPAESLTA
jgi:DNA-binding XRE family transcriptional regulator